MLCSYRYTNSVSPAKSSNPLFLLTNPSAGGVAQHQYPQHQLKAPLSPCSLLNIPQPHHARLGESLSLFSLGAYDHEPRRPPRAQVHHRAHMLSHCPSLGALMVKEWLISIWTSWMGGGID